MHTFIKEYFINLNIQCIIQIYISLVLDNKTVGIIIGSVIGGVAFCSAVIVIIVFLVRNRNKNIREGLLASKNDELEHPSGLFKKFPYENRKRWVTCHQNWIIEYLGTINFL